MAASDRRLRPGIVAGGDTRSQAPASTTTLHGSPLTPSAMSQQFTDDDIGKRVVNADGDEVGMVADVEHGTAHVEPDPGITDSIKARLGWSESGEDTYPLQEEAVGRVTDDEIRLSRDPSGGDMTGGTATGRDDRTR
ncbi:hypothetical protein [Natrinema hispanicum]|nr:hypothetical protein [Natrinema hispanicum]